MIMAKDMKWPYEHPHHSVEEKGMSHESMTDNDGGVNERTIPNNNHYTGNESSDSM